MDLARKIIIDTDPGQDDAVAILLALASPELDILGITCVAGNVPLALTQRNARIICELAGRPDVPVFAGASRPMVRSLVTAEHVHGKTGLNGPELWEPGMPLRKEHAVDFIVKTLRTNRDGAVTLCVLGPLTNIALALIKAPDIAEHIHEIVLMGGGSFEGGNVTPAAEFNIYVDPHAAKVVFSAGIPLVVMPLDLTHQTLTTRDRVARFAGMGSKVGSFTAEMLGFFERFDMEKYGSAGAPLHDPNVIAYLLRPEIYGGREVNIEIETESMLTLGMTVVDWWRVSGRGANATFMREVDDHAFFNLLFERFESFVDS
ncbi:MAG: nucleoside hydrolase [Rhodobacteraceae bacterium]|nr:nucleoside hydrolase [Paracoccaceae bacterium]